MPPNGAEAELRRHRPARADRRIPDIMTITLKSAADIEGMRIAGHLGSEVLPAYFGT